ncbi:MAG: glycoside hydrolase family 127 protein [Candidatus Lokiarchaeota archaeon]|nr:glycoside hydrolase family 127 protein [Candidatus Lokiarchaeota archaeon]
MPIDPIPLADSKITGGFWKQRQDVKRDVSIPATYVQLENTGRIDAFKQAWKPGMPNVPHVFWDSDVAKWVETVAYSLVTKPDPALAKQLNELVASIISAQQPDGYLNTHFTVVEPHMRFKNLRDWHEMYCAGHLMEAAVAHFQATGKRDFLDAMARYADLLDKTFGPKVQGKIPGYCGHPEIELALVKLYKATGNKKYLDLSTFFISERGQAPFYYDIEAQQRGEQPKPIEAIDKVFRDREYRQSHAPIVDTEEIVGHAVRALYLYAGAADVARETNDAELMAALRKIWDNATNKKMYVTGGMGAKAEGEAFGDDYELPNETAYAETCAAIALFFWGHRMLNIEADARYADVMERALYNGTISGVSLSGDKFFYVNPLAANLHGKRTLQRTTWFGCSCCPNNLTRMELSLGQYIYSTSASKDAIFVHLFVEGEARVSIGGQAVTIKQKTIYPWDGKVEISLAMAREVEFAVKVRMPGWCKSVAIGVNGAEMDVAKIPMEKGYMVLSGAWNDGDVIELAFDMPVERMHAHPKVEADSCRVALQRGPIVYCLEEIDNGPGIDGIVIPQKATFLPVFEPGLLGGVVSITGEAMKLETASWEGKLYATRTAKQQKVQLKAVPYFTWGNRKPLQEMLVWIREAI